MQISWKMAVDDPMTMVSAQRLDQEFATSNEMDNFKGENSAGQATKWPAKPADVSGFPGSAWYPGAMAYLQTVLCFDSNHLPHQRLHHGWIDVIWKTRL